jgi:hypothetical protein
MEKLFLVHLGYYDEVSGGVFENHTNIFVVASDFEDARQKTKQLEIVKQKKMHIDGLQLVEAVEGYAIQLIKDTLFEGKSSIKSHHFRELAPKPTQSS